MNLIDKRKFYKLHEFFLQKNSYKMKASFDYYKAKSTYEIH